MRTFVYIQARAVESDSGHLSFYHGVVVAEDEDAAYITGQRQMERVQHTSSPRPEWAEWPLVNDYAIDITDLFEGFRLHLDKGQPAAAAPGPDIDAVALSIFTAMASRPDARYTPNAQGLGDQQAGVAFLLAEAFIRERDKRRNTCGHPFRIQAKDGSGRCIECANGEDEPELRPRVVEVPGKPVDGRDFFTR